MMLIKNQNGVINHRMKEMLFWGGVFRVRVQCMSGVRTCEHVRLTEEVYRSAAAGVTGDSKEGRCMMYKGTGIRE
eukprot:5862575-Pyramimonas_sp.AAC.1